MANNCWVELNIECMDENAAKKLYGTLFKASSEASAKNEGFYAGSDRYIFDAEICMENESVWLQAWVKWGYSHEEVKELKKFLAETAEIKSFTLDYQEPGCLLYGRYSFENGNFQWTHLPEAFWPEEDEFEILEEKLENALKTYGATEAI